MKTKRSTIKQKAKKAAIDRMLGKPKRGRPRKVKAGERLRIGDVARIASEAGAKVVFKFEPSNTGSVEDQLRSVWAQAENNEGKAPEFTAADLLAGMAETYRQRNAVYGDNYLMVGRIMQAMFPNGVQLKTAADYDVWHLMELKILKLSRFAISGLTHIDSIHDNAVYSAMIEQILRKREANGIPHSNPLIKEQHS